jgi:hypothetical protein
MRGFPARLGNGGYAPSPGLLRNPTSPRTARRGVVCANINVLAARTAPEFLPVTTRRKARVGWAKARTARRATGASPNPPIARASLHFVPLSPPYQSRQQQKKKGSGTPKDASSKPLRPPQTRLRSRRKPSAGHSARSVKRARLSASRHGSNPRSVSPLGATPGQASWDADA